ncbi:ATP-dependent DNA helicase Q-like 3 [Mycena sanguinolenta]|uniref:DNA 3'-5' helicase n=1 Tax=Mycena sanguinolenta TaxID=230812 RepID=A0A8H7CJQ4_9AGAR|nr:ATP-dependent DNA helicase Q-like 3 [Mycena sanguinolenta]
MERSHFNWSACAHRSSGKNVILHAATGSGKTGIAAGPHLLPSSAGKVTLMVSPLLSLQAEQVSTFENEFKLKATAINSSNGGCTKENMEKIVAGEWQIVMLSPEMLLSRRFIDGVLRKPAFGSRCLSVFIDEAHCISHWGAGFRKKYASIGIIRAFLPRTTPFIAVTATLTPRVHHDLLTKLQFDPTNYLFCTIGNDRPNVSQIIRAMEHPANSYRDSDFIVPSTMTKPEDIKLAFVYSDDIKDGNKLVDHLNGRVPEPYRDRGLIRPYNASMSIEYRAHVMKLFKAGIIRVLVCTDAAGMGCDIPNVELVVQWKAAQNLSSWIQRAGRAARGPGTWGIAVMLVEKSAFEVSQAAVDATVSTSQPVHGRGGGRGNGLRGRGGNSARGRGKAMGKDYAESHGQKRGSHHGKDDTVASLDTSDSTAEIPQDAPAEGLYALIQATICRRKILSQIFKNPAPAVPANICCDICNPKLFDKVRPPKPVRATRQKGVRKGPPVDSVRDSLFAWRRTIKKTHFPHAMFAPSAILDDSTCETLASIGPVEDISTLQQLLQSSWSHWDEFGVPLFDYMKELDIPALPPPPPRKKAAPASEHTPLPAISSSSPSQVQTPELSRGTDRAKRSHPTHNTSSDDAARPIRRRGQPQKNTSASKPTPTAALPLPLPTHHGYMSASVPPRPSASYSAYSQFSPLPSSTPPRFPAENMNYYLPSTPAAQPSPYPSYQSPAARHHPYSFSSPYMFSPALYYPVTPPHSAPNFNQYPQASFTGTPALQAQQTPQSEGGGHAADGNTQPHRNPNWDDT